MFSWITGPRITNVIEDLQPEPNYESTFIEPPETPAHQFAVNAFKHALFGTPAPEDTNSTSNKSTRKAKLDAANAKAIELPASKEDDPPSSPSKQPGGILMTPGTANKGRKTVSFGSQVVDNEGKRGNTGKSGIPNDCPGKFPSPWTPGTQLKLDPSSDKRPRTKLTEALLDARTTIQPKSGQKPKARDDSDITIDLGAPRSESGKYWKEQYESYAERSEKEMKKVIAKQQLAKKFAMKKDGEVTDLTSKLEQERKRFRQRERELEQQNKDYQERLRLAMAESMSATIEIAALKARVATLEMPNATSLSDFQQSKASFQIYEDASREAIQLPPNLGMASEVSLGASISMASSGKENCSPKPRHPHRQSIPGTSTRPNVPSRLGTAEGEASIILGKSPRALMSSSETASDPAQPPQTSDQPPTSPLRIRGTETSNESAEPKSPAAVLPSSPLPMPSPDPWLENDVSIPQMDKMAMPISAGQPYSRPAWNPPPRHQRGSKSVSHSRPAQVSKFNRQDEKPITTMEDAGRSKVGSRTNEQPVHSVESKTTSTVSKTNIKPSIKPLIIEATKNSEASVDYSPTDPRFDMSKITSHHAEGSTQVKHDRVELLPVDRKEQARRRLEERKKLRKNAPS
ncbi:Nn.00g069300.m01.CDS01 [Neocucurbitaria sp. VM-36]